MIPLSCYWDTFEVKFGGIAQQHHRAAKRNRGCLPGYLRQRGEPAAPSGKGQGRTNTGAYHLYGRPLNGIPVWTEGLEVKSLLWVPSSASIYWTEYKYSCTWLYTAENLSLQNFKHLWLLNLLQSEKNNTCCNLLTMLSLLLGVFEDGKQLFCLYFTSYLFLFRKAT